jgi:GPI inositol-deacylase
MLMLWILPINVPVLVVWVHNLAVHWLTPFTSHHNVLSIMPFILLVETLTGGKMIPRVTWRCVLGQPSGPTPRGIDGPANVIVRFRHATNVLLFLFAVYAAIYGATYAYQLHYLANLVCFWLVAIHFSGSTLTLSGISQMLEGESESGHVKKTP